MVDAVVPFPTEREKPADVRTRAIPPELQTRQESVLVDRKILVALIAAVIACAILAKANWSDAALAAAPSPTTAASAIGRR